MAETSSGRVPKARCEFRHDDGRACRKPQWREGRFCYHHDPAARELRKEQIGRRQRTKPPSEEELQAIAAAAMEDLRAGKLSPGQGYAIGYLAQTLLSHERQRKRKPKRKRKLTPQQEAREVRRRWRALHGLNGGAEKNGEEAKPPTEDKS